MQKNILVDLITISILFSFAVYHLLLYIGRRKFINEKYNLYFSLFSFSFILYIIFSSTKSLANVLITNYNYDYNPPISYFTALLMIFFFVKILIELIHPAKKFFYISISIFSILAIVEILSFLSIIYGIVWFKNNISFYLMSIVAGFSVIFIIIFSYYIIIRKSIKNLEIMIFSVAFIFLGLYMSIYNIVSYIFTINNYYSHSFISIYIILVAYSLSLKSNKEYNQLRKFKNELELKVQEKTNQIKLMTEQKTRFFMNLAHETKTPLTLISNYLENYMKKNKKDEDLIIIKNNIDKMKTDIVNYFDMEKIISGIDFYDNEKISCISDLVEEKIKLFRPNAVMKSINMTKDVDKNLFVKIDPYALDRILNNLIENAIKFTDKKNGKIDVNLKSDFGKIILKVTDNGQGIEEDKLDKIFEPYFQIQNEKRNIQGIGLGLNIVKKIIEKIDGSIKVESRLNEGSCFSVCFEKYDISENESINNIQLSKPNSIPSFEIKKDFYRKGRHNVLIVEDNIQLLNFLHIKLSEKFNCFLARNGKEALEKLKKIPKPGIIISDIMMDEIDGFLFYDELKKEIKFRDVPFIFVTAKTGKGNRIEGLKKGAVDYITKPFIIDELMYKIDSIVKNNLNQVETIKNKIIRKLYDDSEFDEEIMENHDLNIKVICDKFKITEKEMSIIKLILKGYEYKTIGSELNIPINTLKKNVQLIFNKCSVRNKIELVNIFR
jgi:two-component system, sensor histidine kinase ChiS